MKEILELETRRSIYQLIVKNPGLYARRVAEILELSGQLTDYHLLFLEKNGLITSVKEEGYRRYYAHDEIKSGERKRLVVLWQETPLRIILYLLEHPYSLHRDILEQVHVAPSTLTYQLRKLIKHGIIETFSLQDRERERYVIANTKEIIGLLIRFKPYSQMESLKDTWKDLK
jgi:predicted transcriptional regulator